MRNLKLENQKSTIINLYQKGKNVAEIASMLNEYEQAVCNILKKYTKYIGRLPQGNIRYFQKINSDIKAYFLGFIAADGCIQNNGKNSLGLTITIHEKDRIIIDKLRKEIGSEKPILQLKAHPHVRFTLFNIDMYNDLKSHGMEERKSLTMKNIIKNIPKKYRKSFILGYFDGDGSVSLPIDCRKPNINTKKISVQIRGTDEFLQGIVDELKIKQCSIRHYDSIPNLTIGKKEEIIKFFKIYDNCSFFLKRKHDKFLKRLY